MILKKNRNKERATAFALFEIFHRICSYLFIIIFYAHGKSEKNSQILTLFNPFTVIIIFCTSTSCGNGGILMMVFFVFHINLL